jgi:methylisocitrate lyase
MKNFSRRDFGKSVSVGALGSLAAGSLAQLAQGQGDSSQSRKRTTTVLREMIKSPGIITGPAIHDPMTARMAERAGFRWVDVAGSALGEVTCIPEPALSLEDMAEAIRRITAAVDIPVTVDAGAGFGEPAHVVQTVRTLEHAGAAGMHMEDQIYPKRFHYHIGVEHTISAEAMIDKIQYAHEARRDPDFVIIARTDTIRTHSFAEGIRRANLYAKAGADIVQLFPSTIEEARQVPKEVDVPLNFVNGTGGTRPIIPAPDLEAMGYKVLFVTGLTLASYKAVRDVLTQLKRTGSLGMDQAVYGPLSKELQELIGLPYYYDVEDKTTEKG